MKFINFILLYSTILLANTVANAQTFTTKNGYGEFRAKATFNSYKGISNELEGKLNLDNRQLFFKIPIKSLDTDNNLRNDDMFDLMQVDKFPYAEFTGSIISGFSATSEAKQTVQVSGNFTLRGVTKPLKVTGTLNRNGNSVTVETTFNLLLTDFNIDPPNILINKVKDKHTIYIKATLEKQPQ